MTAVDLAKCYYASQAPGFRQNLMEILDPEIEVEVQQGFPGGRPQYHGLKEYFEDFLDVVYGQVELEFQPEEYLECEPHAVVIGRIRGRATGSGVCFDVPFVHLWTSDGRHLSSVRYFTDTAVLRDAVAGLPARVK